MEEQLRGPAQTARNVGSLLGLMLAGGRPPVDGRLTLFMLGDAALYATGPADNSRLQWGIMVAGQLAAMWAQPPALVAALEVDLERWQRSQGFDPLLAAQQARELSLALAAFNSRVLGVQLEKQGQRAQARQVLTSAQRYYQQLAAMHPHRATFPYFEAAVLALLPGQAAASVAKCRTALELAEAANGEG